MQWLTSVLPLPGSPSTSTDMLVASRTMLLSAAVSSCSPLARAGRSRIACAAVLLQLTILCVRYESTCRASEEGCCRWEVGAEGPAL